MFKNRGLQSTSRRHKIFWQLVIRHQASLAAIFIGQAGDQLRFSSRHSLLALSLDALTTPCLCIPWPHPEHGRLRPGEYGCCFRSARSSYLGDGIGDRTITCLIQLVRDFLTLYSVAEPRPEPINLCCVRKQSWRSRSPPHFVAVIVVANTMPPTAQTSNTHAASAARF